MDLAAVADSAAGALGAFAKRAAPPQRGGRSKLPAPTPDADSERETIELVAPARESDDDKSGLLADAIDMALDEGDTATVRDATDGLIAPLDALTELKAKRLGAAGAG